MNCSYNRLLFSLFISFGFLNSLHAQDASSFWLRVSDDFAPADSIWLTFSNSPGGTYAKDSLNLYYQEQEAPPGAPSFDARWVQIAANKPGEYGSGFSPLDVRGMPQNPAQKDTFVVQITNGDANAAQANFTVSWPCAAYLSQRCDSMFIIDKTGLLTDTTGVTNIGTINMFTKNSITILEPLQTLLTFKLTIYKYGVHLAEAFPPDWCHEFWCTPHPPDPCITEAKDGESSRPNSFTLHQNYPNPFNPSTTIRYTIAKRELVTIKVFNVFGQTVTTLVNQIQNVGEQSVTWDASNVPSGVYFYRLQAGSFVEVKKMIMMK